MPFLQSIIFAYGIRLCKAAVFLRCLLHFPFVSCIIVTAAGKTPHDRVCGFERRRKMGRKKALYDREVFFENYLRLRGDAENYNDLIEQPAMFALLPDLKGKAVLDLGCGYGPSSVKLHALGAASVLGVDVSKSMIGRAISENSADGVRYQLLDAARLDELDGRFDLVFSSLMLHYIKDLSKLFRDVCRLLNDGGELVFSMEHPIVTAPEKGGEDVKNENGEPVGFMLSDYAKEGKRTVTWLQTPVEKYHRKTSTILCDLINAGFEIVKVSEPTPGKALRDRIPRMRAEVNRPCYLLCKCRKRG